MYSCLDDQRAGFQKRIKQLEIQLEEEESERQSAHKQRKEAELKLNVSSCYFLYFSYFYYLGIAHYRSSQKRREWKETPSRYPGEQYFFPSSAKKNDDLIRTDIIFSVTVLSSKMHSSKSKFYEMTLFREHSSSNFRPSLKRPQWIKTRFRRARNR